MPLLGEAGLLSVFAIAGSLFSLVAMLALIAIWRRCFADTRIRAAGQFAKAPLPPIELYNLFELGVVDLDGDDRLDLFTANHDFGQSYLLAARDGSYSNVATRLQLDQDRNFPGMEDRLDDHETPVGHFSIFMLRRCLVLRDRGLADRSPIAGTILMNGRVAIRRTHRAEVQIARPRTDPRGIGLAEVTFRIGRGGCVQLFAPLLGTPIGFSLDPDVPLARVHVGRGDRSPTSNRFTVLRRDRHGHAWADINGDGHLDVFIGRGAFQGELTAVRRSLAPGAAVIEDELLINDGGCFVDRSAALGFEKKDCRTRGGAWVDVDNSGRLALYVSCLTARNQLWMRRDNGPFVDVAHAAGLDLTGCFSFIWLDVDRDGWMDLVIDEGETIAVYYNLRNLRFRREAVAAKSRRFEVKLSVADFNKSGYPSIVAASPVGLLLLVNEGGVLKMQDAVERGLPAEGLNAQWVDYDNDGNMELCVVPHGLYRQVGDGRFQRTDAIRFARPQQSVEALVQWFDADNSGFRDAIIALRRPLPRKVRRLIAAWDRIRALWVHVDARPDLAPGFNEGVGYEYYMPTIYGRWSATSLKNRGNRNNWLQVVLEGRPGNPQAIGATVTIEATSGRQLQGVGWADGALYSQGHYRVYFGLGSAKVIDRLEVGWPLGGAKVIENVAVNRILHIRELIE